MDESRLVGLISPYTQIRGTRFPTFGYVQWEGYNYGSRHSFLGVNSVLNSSSRGMIRDEPTT